VVSQADWSVDQIDQISEVKGLFAGRTVESQESVQIKQLLTILLTQKLTSEFSGREMRLLQQDFVNFSELRGSFI
jgi:hypothetical protein